VRSLHTVHGLNAYGDLSLRHVSIRELLDVFWSNLILDIHTKYCNRISIFIKIGIIEAYFHKTVWCEGHIWKLFACVFRYRLHVFILVCLVRFSWEKRLIMIWTSCRIEIIHEYCQLSCRKSFGPCCGRVTLYSWQIARFVRTRGVVDRPVAYIYIYIYYNFSSISSQ
jgi:hypothetical protein